MSDEAPDVVRRYLRSADEQDIEALAACFTPNGFVIDEDHKYVGHDEIIRWRRELLGRFTYTSTLTGTEPAAMTSTGRSCTSRATSPAAKPTSPTGSR